MQPAVGPFPEWELLTVETLHKKMDLGGAESEDYLVLRGVIPFTFSYI